MFRSKPKKQPTPGGPKVPGMDAFMNFDDPSFMGAGGGNENFEDDPDLLAELAALEREHGTAEPSAPSRPAPARPAPRASQPPAVAIGGLDERVLAAALAEDHHGGSDEEGDFENEPELEGELARLTGQSAPAPSDPPPARSTAQSSSNSNSALVSRLAQLSTVYSKMLSQAEANGDGTKARRYQRTVQKLKELSAAAARGQHIEEDDIPPVPPGFQFNADAASPAKSQPSASSREAPPLPPRNSSKPPSSGKREEIRALLAKRRDAYTANGKLAVAARDKATALEFVNMSKQFDQALAAIDTVSEDDLDFNDIPPSPPPYRPTEMTQPQPVAPQPAPRPAPSTALSAANEATDNSKKTRIVGLLRRRMEANVQYGKAAIAASDKEAAKGYMGAAKQFQEALNALESVSVDDLDESEIPPSPQPFRSKPKTFLDGLIARQQQFQGLVTKFKAQGDERKVRMNTRMVQQYAEAIQEARAGRQVNVEELPTLPNMGPLPPQTAGSSAPSQPSSSQSQPRKALPEVGPLAAGAPGQSRNQTQIDFLVKRQTEFKQAAMHAKQHGNMEKAKEYLLKAKGFDPMIKAAQAGLPVSIKDTPIPPQDLTPASTLKPKIVAAGGSSDTGVEKRGEVLSLLERTLIEQVQKAENNRLRFTRLGDVGKVKLFEEWAKASKSDLLLVREVAKQQLRIPPFHYEQRAVPNAELFPELAEDICEITVHNAVQVPLPAGYENQHANIFVKFEFPFPTEKHQIGQTKLVAGTASPEFDETIQVQIGTKKSRGLKLMRVLKRVPLKLEVYQKGGFLRSDKLLGSAELKLEELDGVAQIEESLPLKEGRKAVGGMLRVRVKVREPLGDGKVGIKHEKWLILDS